MTPAILIMGPTASGKSALAMTLAERFDGEIVSVDSAQVYRGMDIGTAKPDVHARAQRPHHLLDVVEPTDAYSAARFVRDAMEAIDAIRARGRLPIVAGGTMLYFKALTEGLSSLPQADASVRARIDSLARERGWPAMHDELARVDAPTAARLDRGDAQRIQRALEVFMTVGEPLSALQGRREAVPLGARVSIALLPSDRSMLHDAIAKRFDAMLAGGLVAELEMLRARHALDPALPSMRAVGYRQAWRYLEGDLDAAGLRSSGIAATRQLAKRQITWLRATEALPFDPFDPATTQAVVRTVGSQLP